MKGRVSWIAVGFLTLWIAASDVMASEMDALSPPDMDLIEFLGGWETEAGEWVDPALLDAVFSQDLGDPKSHADPDLKSWKDQKEQDAALREKTRKMENDLRKEKQ